MRKIINFFNSIHIFFIVLVNRIKFFKKIWKCYSYPFDIYESLFDIDMELFKIFFEQSGIDDIVDWDHDAEHRKVRFNMGEIYEYYFERRDLKRDYDYLIKVPCDNKRRDGRDMFDKNTPEERELYRMAFSISNHLENRDHEIMIKLMEIRKYLWV